MPETSISGVLIHAQPKHLSTIESTLNTIKGVEVHATDTDGKMVVTVEEEGNNKVVADTVLGFQSIEGVLSASLVYQYYDDLGE